MTRISLIQLFVLCFNSSFGASMVTLPRSLADEAKEDMWLALVVGAVFFLITVWVATKLASYYPRNTIIEINRILLGPVFGQVMNIFLLIIITGIPSLSLRYFGMGVNSFLLAITPPQVFTVVILLLLVYGAQHGLAPLIRLQQFNFAPTQFLFLTLLLLGFLAVNTDNYLPLLAEGIMPVLKASIPVWYAYTGPEMVIGFLYPFVTRKQAVFKWGAAAVGALCFLYTLITVIVQGILGVKETAYLIFPTIIAYRAVEIPDTFIERLDGYFIVLWIPLFFFCMLNWFYFACFGAARMMKLESSRPLMALLAPVIFYVVFAVPKYPDLVVVNKWLNMAFMGWGLGVLPLLLALAWLKARKGGLVESPPRQN